MDWILTPYALVMFLTAAITATVGYLALGNRRTQGGLAIALMLFALAEWSLATGIEYLVVDIAAKVFWAKIEYVGLVAAPVCFLIFALEYTRRDKFFSPRRIALLCIVPAIILLLAWTNEWHYLIWTYFTPSPVGNNLVVYGHGIGLWIGAAYFYTLILIGVVALVRYGIRYAHVYRRQAIVVLLSAIIPVVGNLVYMLDLSPAPGVDLALLSFALTGLLLAANILYFRMFDLVPVARDLMIENMSDGVLVLNAHDRIVDLNPAARQIVATTAAAIGQDIRAVLSAWRDLGERLQSRAEIYTEVNLGQAAPRWYDLGVTPLYGREQELTGRLIVLRDISARKRAELELQQRLGELETMHAISQATAAQLDLNALLEFVGQELLQIFDIQGTYIALLDRATNLLTFPYWQALGERLTVKPVPLQTGLTATLLRTRRPLLINQAYERRVTDLGGLRVPGPQGKFPLAWLGVPMIARDEVIGALSVQNFERENVFTDADVRLLTTIAASVGIAIRNAQLYTAAQTELRERKQAEEELRRANERLHNQLTQIEQLQTQLQDQAIRDPLTGLFNRRYMEQVLANELARATQESSPLSLVMLDIDHFKIVNDTLGHKVGDRVLQQICELIRSRTRQMDVTCRYGGEEVLVIMPTAPTAVAARRAEEWRAAVETSSLDFTEQALRLTISLGVATFPAHGTTSDALLTAADRALYAAKESGRNCVRIANGESR